MASSGDTTSPPLASRGKSVGGTKSGLKTPAKRLPWLDGKTSPAVSNANSMQGVSVDGTVLSSEENESLPGMGNHRAPQSSSRTPSGRTIGSAPLLNRNPFAPSAERRVSSAGASPSSTPRKLSHASRNLGKKPPSPLAEEDSGFTSSPDSGRRPSVIRASDYGSVVPDIGPKDVVGKAKSRKGSLAPVPAHLEEPSSSPEFFDTTQTAAPIASPPAVVKSAEVLPSQPVPKRKSFGNGSDKRRLSNAIEGLEDLVQEAVDIADENADEDQVREVYEIIKDATLAVREASEMPTQDLMATASPLEASSSPEEMPGEKQRGSVATDWAYKNSSAPKQKMPFSSSSSSSDDSIRQRRARFDYRSDRERLLPPRGAHATSREHTDYVLRPARSRSYSRGRSRRRRGGGSESDARRPRRQRNTMINIDPDSSHRGSRHLSSSIPSSEEEEEEEVPRLEHRPRKRREHNSALSGRDQAHHHTFSLRRHHHRQPIARNWSTGKKRITATIACINTALIGIIVGIYAGEVPRVQYVLADERHHVIVGNVVLYAGLAISTFVSWPLPLLHGRKPYILAALALALPLQFPQAIVISAKRSPKRTVFRTGLLVTRAISGLVLGFANVNFVTVLLDLFGASLQSKNPHQEVVVINDVRRHGGGMGIWLGIWSWCAIGSIAVGFQIGAAIIEKLTPDWGFYIVIIILAAALVLNILAPETRRSTYRRSVTEVYDRDENFIIRRVARGEVKLHIDTDGPKYWFEEAWAGMKLSGMMCLQPGFFILALYLAWIYAQIVLVIVLLGAMLSRSYKWHPRYVGLGVMSIAFGALLAVPLTKAGIFSRERKKPFRTDSMTFQKQVSWSSHLVRRIIFMLMLPLMGLAYSVSAMGRPKPFIIPIIFAGAIGFLSVLAIAECHGLMMETFDTCDLQPGVNTRHRLQSMAAQDRRRRTNYSSFPRVTAGFFASQTLAFIGAAIATVVGGIMTRRIGAQASTSVTAGILLGLTILLTAVLWRFKEVQVIPNHAFGTRRDTRAWQEFKEIGKDDWKPVVIGNPSGKMRKMSVLELGGLSRWTEIRKLNYLIRDGNETPSWRTPRPR